MKKIVALLLTAIILRCLWVARHASVCCRRCGRYGEKRH